MWLLYPNRPLTCHLPLEINIFHCEGDMCTCVWNQLVKIPKQLSCEPQIQIHFAWWHFSSLPPCLCQDIVTRHLTEKSAAEDQLPPLGPVGWAAGSQSELTPSESLATSDAVRNALLPPSLSLSHTSTLCTSPELFPSSFIPFCYHLHLLPLPYFISFSALSPFIPLCFVSFNLSVSVFILWI